MKAHELRIAYPLDYSANPPSWGYEIHTMTGRLVARGVGYDSQQAAQGAAGKALTRIVGEAG